MELRLFNTMGRRIEAFVPREKGKAGMYACGLTVYNDAHVGNLRTFIFEDVLRRTLQYAGCEVRHVMNVTDVGHLAGDSEDGEDKMVKSSRESGRTVWEIAEFYTQAFLRDFAALGCIMPTVLCRATDHIADMVALIKRLQEKGFTYSAGGNLYFDIAKFSGYGALAQLDRQDLRAGARVAVDEGKRNPADFALWFTKSKFAHQAMVWDSPWGRGYPGWHIECSAMSMKYLGESFDIHCGAIDLVPVHHTNEIAQSEAATGGPWVRYWLHGEFLLMGRDKMAKSAGNFVTLSTILEKGYHPLDYRYFCLGAHYRTQLAFTWEALDSARAGRQGLVERVAQVKAEASAGPEAPAEKAGEHLAAFEAHAAEDLNMPNCLADLWMLLRDSSVSPGQKLGAVLRMDAILGLDLAAAKQAEVILDEEAGRLVAEREQARKSRDFRKADEIRAALLARGIEIQDSPQGPKLRFASGRKRQNPVTSEG